MSEDLQPSWSRVVSRTANKGSLTILISCLNEEDMLRLTFSEVLEAARTELDVYEFILINDGSTDGTANVISQLAEENPGLVTVVTNPVPKGVASAFREAVRLAKCDYLTFIPGDRAFAEEGIREMFAAVGMADLVVTYRLNQREARSGLRYVTSSLFNRIILSMFSLPLRDVHSINIYPVEPMRKMTIIGEKMAFQIEVMVKLFRDQIRWLQLPVALTPQKDSHNRSLSISNAVNLAKVIKHLLFDS